MSDRTPPLDLDALRRLARQGEPELWRSLEQAFPDVVQAGGMDRRTWLRLIGSSLALGGLPGCERAPAEAGNPLLSQARNTPGVAPGAPLVFATSLELDGYGRGALVKSRDGRPIKIEGNPRHPASLGAADPFMQAQALSLYDPDRSRAPTQRGIPRSFDELQRFLRPLRNELVVDEGRGLHVLSRPTSSPTVARLTAAARELYPHAAWHTYAPLGEDNRRAGAQLAFGRAVDLVHDLTAADVVLMLGGDILAAGPGHLRHAADHQARRREPGRPLPRLWCVEASPSLAGARADERIVLRPREIEPFARALASGLGIGTTPPAEAHPAALWVAASLSQAGPRGLVAVGREQPPAVHALAHAVNARLGAIGSAVRTIEPVLPPVEEMASITALAEALAAGRVSRLLVLGGNPAYDAPADLGLAELIRRVPISLHLGPYRDETAAACGWHVPQCHELEAFGDLRAFDGSLGLCQPATERLVPCLSLAEALGLLSGLGTEGRDLVAATWRETWAEDFEERLARAFEDGVAEGTAFATVPVSLRPDWDRAPGGSAGPGPVEIVFAPDASAWDGCFANNAWLQELPRPLTKQVWGNAALLAPRTAEAYGLGSGDVVEIASGGRRVAAPVLVLPGQAPDTVTLPLGYGRSAAGALGSRIGVDFYPLRSSLAPWAAPAELRPTGRREALVTTQRHHGMEGRPIVRTVTPEAPALPPPAAGASLYPAEPSPGHAWGMVVDLDACIGCNACVIACQAENNVPVVGPKEVARGREMHWLRVDRYYAGDPSGPETYFQPVPCMHCESAPCEVVCPVNATVHSAEGLNDMVYARCIGTRTCSNNCPYKVRRFNFFDYSSAAYSVPDDVLNPEVTVRGRGVMEKCTYCVQRIAAARIGARLEGRALADGEIVTACQQACPTQAITFGDVNDGASRVSRLRADRRAYALLGDLNTRPRTTYLARIELRQRGADGSGG